ncbi:hypothetical protein V1581_20510 [Enterobacter bugandensis]|uniref:hypothetical protein n=1 Tax=Enterobacteriaceae TaxID=543 RepID=UPI001858AFFA|nr:hypothetical protein [Escherichia coli]EEG9161366.1 hypothetical protein [Salmonella enterica]EIY5005991.1 hypothetical protein [Klebsiella variicola]HCF8985725.1 hypothetical protein [Klebsiella pneumoniae]EFM6524472.1 hypothetical protein [Escherichia coli]MDF0767902.1 hypothetical protein [Escherichia coli]
MSKYKKAFNEVNLLMNEVLDKFKMTLDETNFYPTEDIFRIVVREIEVDNLKVISSIFTNNEYHEVKKYMTPAVNKFMHWWGDNLDCDYIDITALIAKKEESILSPIMSNHLDSETNQSKKRI